MPSTIYYYNCSEQVKNLSYRDTVKSVNHKLSSKLEKSGSGSSLDSQDHGLVFQAGPGGDSKE